MGHSFSFPKFPIAFSHLRIFEFLPAWVISWQRHTLFPNAILGCGHYPGFGNCQVYDPATDFELFIM